MALTDYLYRNRLLKGALIAFFTLLTFASIGVAKENKVADALSEASTITIESDKMNADNKENFVVFSGDVIATERFTLCSDKLRIDYKDANEISDITATGNVRVVKDSKVARAEKARYDKAKGTIILTGKPSVTQCGDLITGERITFNIEDETAMVDSGSGGRVKAVIMPEKECTGKEAVEEDICRRAR